MQIGKRTLGGAHGAYVIFEVASTHGGDLEAALGSVRKAADAGADAVKFQLFSADTLVAPITKGLRATYEYFKQNETPREWYAKLHSVALESGIDLLCTPFSIEAADFLQELSIPAFKVASGDLTNSQLLLRIARFGKPVILSTGMATLEEVEAALQTLRAGGAADIVLLQSVSVYPTSFEDANVQAMRTLGDTFNVPVGYSDNGSKGELVPLLAVALGASVIEKHVTSQKERGGIDDVFSLSVEEFASMVRAIRAAEALSPNEQIARLEQQYGVDVMKARGDGIKRPALHGTLISHPGSSEPFIQKESDERHWARRGVYPSRDIRKGETISEDMLILLRPDVGVSAPAYRVIIGGVALEDLPARMPLLIANDGVRRFRRTDTASVYGSVDHAFAESLLRNWDSTYE